MTHIKLKIIKILLYKLGFAKRNIPIDTLEKLSAFSQFGECMIRALQNITHVVNNEEKCSKKQSLIKNYLKRKGIKNKKSFS